MLVVAVADGDYVGRGRGPRCRAEGGNGKARGQGQSWRLQAPKAEAHPQLLTIGLALQLVSYAFFTVVFTVFIHRVRTREPQTWRASVMQSKPWTSDWRALAGALAVSCVGILVRDIPAL